MVKVVCISDTHEEQDYMTHPVPDGDILLHAGDIMSCGTDREEIIKFCDWYSSFPHKHKIFIAGNHDHHFENYPDDIIDIMKGYPSLTYLLDQTVEVEGLKIHGSPWQPWFHNWAFNLTRNGEDLKEKWAMIPKDTDILITHGPPFGYLDRVASGSRVGCELLDERVKEVKPKIHLFGHIHEAYGVRFGYTDDGDLQTLYVNASICNLSYFPKHEPILIDMEGFNDKSRPLLGKHYKRG